MAPQDDWGPGWHRELRLPCSIHLTARSQLVARWDTMGQPPVMVQFSAEQMILFWLAILIVRGLNGCVYSSPVPAGASAHPGAGGIIHHPYTAHLHFPLAAFWLKGTRTAFGLTNLAVIVPRKKGTVQSPYQFAA